MDWPRNQVVPTHINNHTRWMNALSWKNVASPGIPASTNWTANAAIYIPMFLPFPYVVRRVFHGVGSAASGHSDIGIYTKSGTRLFSIGSFNNAGASSLQHNTVSPEYLLQPGRYWFAYSNDGTTNQVFGVATQSNPGRMAGLRQESSAFPLPATATFAQYAGIFVPLVGLTNTDSGF